MKRRRKRRPMPERPMDRVARILAEEAAKPERLDTMVARMLAEGEARRAAAFRELLAPSDITEEYLVRAMARSGSDVDAEPKAGSAAAWIDDLWPKDKWRLMKIKRMHDDIVKAAVARNIPDPPSETAVRDEVNSRLGKPRKRAKRAKRGKSAR
jgi:hypothetical protein